MTSSEPVLTPDNPDFWRERYQNQTARWDLGQGAPAFQALVKAHDPLSLPIGKTLVIGCGKGHDAALFAEYGHTVTGIDFAPEAIEAARSRYSTAPFAERLQFKLADLFDLPEAMHGQFDTVIEHTCFCAIRPKDRPRYVKAVHQCLKPGGKLVGIFWTHAEWGGPPYSTTMDELKIVFGPEFEFVYLERTPHSIDDRAGEEWLGVLQKH